MSVLSFFGNAISGLVAGYLLGLLGMGSGVSFAESVANLRIAFGMRDFSLAMCIPTLLVGWGFTTAALFGAPQIYAVSVSSGKPASDEIIVRLVFFYIAAYWFIRIVIHSVVVSLSNADSFRKKGAL